MKHDQFCEVAGDYYTSGCDSFCPYYRQAVAECVELGEHLRMTTVDPARGDVCFNCGTSD